MLWNYFKTAWRNLSTNKAFSLLNIFGLSIGMAIALLIGLWVHYQFSYDRFLPAHEYVYQVRYQLDDNGTPHTQASTCLPLGEVIKKDVPGVKYVVNTDWIGQHGLVAGEKKLYLSGAMASADFLNMFQYPLLKGSAARALQDPHSIVLTASAARALFGDEDPLNKTVRIDNQGNLTVTAVLKDVPANSTLQFKYLVPFSYYIQANNWVKSGLTDWGNNSFQTFVALQPQATYAQVAPYLNPLLQKYAGEIYKPSKGEVFMQPMKEWHLYTDFENSTATGGLIDYVKMFGLIGILVLLIACINFINLSTARSEKRAKEVGIRKAIGSLRKHLVFQFLTESLLITFTAFLFALLLVQLVMPFFNMLTKSTISVPYKDLYFWCLMVGYVLLTGLLAGGRPALYLSSFRPVKVLKGTVRTGRSAALPRKVLVVLQFSCSVALIISAVTVYRQIRYVKDRPLGYDSRQLVMTDASNDLNRNYTALKNDMLQSGAVTDVTMASSGPTYIASFNHVDDWQGKFAGEVLGGMATIIVSDISYFKTLGIQLKEGSNFTGNFAADSNTVILNEAAVQRLRFKKALLQDITWAFGKQRVVGVVKNALMLSPFAADEPTFFVYRPNSGSSIVYRLSPTVSTHDAIARLTTIFNKYNPSYPYLYKFTDDSYLTKFDFETLVGKLSAIFAALAVFISCLGLFGLAAYMAEQRVKELGIRKVLGASVPQLWLLLSADFILLVIISCIIASPAAFYFLHKWLLKYDYRISIGPGIFILAAAVAVITTIITISFQAIKAATANPVKSLRSE